MRIHLSFLILLTGWLGWSGIAPAGETTEEQGVTGQVDEAPTRHPGFYIHGLTFAASLREDDQNRLTFRDSRDLEGIGVTLRAGGVVNDHHLVGGRLTVFGRRTRSVRSAAGLDDTMGFVLHGFAGPEYRYVTDFGLYFGGSLGVGMTVARADTDSENCQWPEDESLAHRTMSVGGMLEVGYEWRLSRYFALYIELFAGGFRGLDEDERRMNVTLGGLAFGIGI